MGHDAVILHTRTLSQRYWLGIRRREIVQITAGRGLNLPDRRRGLRGDGGRGDGGRGDLGRGDGGRDFPRGDGSGISSPPLGRGGPGGGTYTPFRNPNPYLETAGVRSRVSQPIKDVFPQPTLNGGTALAAANGSLPSRQGFLETPAAGNAAILGLSQDVSSLTSLVKSLVTEVRNKQNPQVPEELFSYYMQLIDNHVAEEIASEIVKAVCDQLRPDQRTQPALVNERIARSRERNSKARTSLH
jgi:hypothetical protein